MIIICIDAILQRAVPPAAIAVKTPLGELQYVVVGTTVIVGPGELRIVAGNTLIHPFASLTDMV
ncbi:MAG: hypothetical protein IPP34_18795 [Bacteroidetes bacterium]|nr:hypothetical protein [Bacteroidota bacterium]